MAALHSPGCWSGTEGLARLPPNTIAPGAGTEGRRRRAQSGRRGWVSSTSGSSRRRRRQGRRRLTPVPRARGLHLSLEAWHPMALALWARVRSVDCRVRVRHLGLRTLGRCLRAVAPPAGGGHSRTRLHLAARRGVEGCHLHSGLHRTSVLAQGTWQGGRQSASSGSPCASVGGSHAPPAPLACEDMAARRQPARPRPLRVRRGWAIQSNYECPRTEGANPHRPQLLCSHHRRGESGAAYLRGVAAGGARLPVGSPAAFALGRRAPATEVARRATIGAGRGA